MAREGHAGRVDHPMTIALTVKQYEICETRTESLQARRNWIIYIVSFMMSIVCALLLSTWYTNIPQSIEGAITAVSMVMLVYAWSADGSLNKQIIAAANKGLQMEKRHNLQDSMYSADDYVTGFWDVSRVEVALIAWIVILGSIVVYNI